MSGPDGESLHVLRESVRSSSVAALVVALLGVVSPAASGTAHAASLECGNAFLELNAVRTSGFIVQSCAGEGTVVYTIGRLGLSSFQMSHYFPAPGLSIRKPITMDPQGDSYITTISWEQK